MLRHSIDVFSYLVVVIVNFREFLTMYARHAQSCYPRPSYSRLSDQPAREGMMTDAASTCGKLFAYEGVDTDRK